jgi:hypothetical protein
MLLALAIAFGIGFLLGFLVMFVKYQQLKEQMGEMADMLKTPVGDLVTRNKRR